MAKKRSLESTNGDVTDNINDKQVTSQIIGISRSISACQRCRIKKVKCDQNFPKCSKCSKAGVECIGLDPATGREIPRSYVIHLEERIAALEQQLNRQAGDVDPHTLDTVNESNNISNDTDDQRVFDEVKFDSVNTKSNRSISTDQSISFAKLMTTAVKFQRKSGDTVPQIDPTTGSNATTSTDTTNQGIPLALLPPKKTAQEFIRIFFAQSNSQLPILHREEFLKNFFIPIYGKLDANVSLASHFTAINSLLFQDDEYYKDETLTWFYQYKSKFNQILTQFKRTNQHIDPIKISKDIQPPLKFQKALYFLNMVFAIASSVNLLSYPLTISESFKLLAMKYVDLVYTSSDQLENLQGILLLSVYSIMRPNLPGCWYVIGSAMRLCIDLGLHNKSINQKSSSDAFMLDKRRRLLWCTYSIDRQICFYLSRPVGFPDHSITTPYPSCLDDSLIIPNQPLPSHSNGMSSYKYISLSFFKIRKIQSEVQGILFENQELPREFLVFNDWRVNIMRQLDAWKDQVPKTRRNMNCDFNQDFFQLNYHHTVVVLYGLSPKHFKLTPEDFYKVSESSKELINIYANLRTNKMINYTWAAVLNLFMAGTSYLYTIYNSELVRHQNSLFEVKKFTQDCINVMNSLVDKCDAALSCKNTFEMLTSAVIKLKYNETVHANFNIPTDYQIQTSQVVGPGNGNLNNLMEGLEQQKHRFSDLNPFQVSQTYLDSDFEKNLMTKYLTSDIIHSPVTFEWAEESKSQHDELNEFFDELKDSPGTNSGRNSLVMDVPMNQVRANSPENVALMNIANTLYPYETQLADSSPTSLNSLNTNTDAMNHKNDSRKIYELIHQVPIDAIWDQFFTTPAVPN